MQSIAGPDLPTQRRSDRSRAAPTTIPPAAPLVEVPRPRGRLRPRGAGRGRLRRRTASAPGGRWWSPTPASSRPAGSTCCSATCATSGSTPWSGRDVTPNPKDHEIRAAYERYVEQGCDVLIAIGGGSCIDAAKGVAILSGNDGDILDYAGVDQVTKPIPPMLMIPSTSGTGADVSQFCIVTDTDALGEDHDHGPRAGARTSRSPTRGC